MKSKIFAALISVLSLGSVFADTKTGPINTIRVFGQDYPSWIKGGLEFTITGMPTDVGSFMIAPDDVSLDRYYSSLITAKSKAWQVEVIYTKGSYCPGGLCEAYVSNIIIK
jgi:hypothetical protein